MRSGLGGALSVTASELWSTEIRAGRGFALGATQAPVAAQNSHVQVLNPAASGKQIIVRALIATVGAASLVYARRYDVALATDAGAGVNLLAGSAAGVAHVYTGGNVGLLGTEIVRTFLNAGVAFQPVPDWFAELSPGQGVVVATGVVNTELDVTYFWREV